MNLLLILLLFTAQLQQSLLQEEEDVSKVADLDDEVKTEIVEMHNFIRRNVKPSAKKMMKMIWSKETSKGAEQWAAKCTGTQSPKLNLIVNGKIYGESIFQSNHPASWSYVLSVWYNSGKHFKYGKMESKKDFATYTQMIWDRSRMIGCALAYCPNNNLPFFYICRYYPTGNIENLLATPYDKGFPCEDCPNNCEDKLCNTQCNYKDNSMDCKYAFKFFGCKNKWMKNNCAATCKCGQ